MIVDFDGTLTTRDTTRFLLLSLLWMRPWLVFNIVYGFIAIRRSQCPEFAQRIKNRMIAALVKGVSVKKLDSAINRYRKFCAPFLRMDLLVYLKSKSDSGVTVLIVTASPEFLVSEVLCKDFIVLGTEFEAINQKYTGRCDEVGCFGAKKLHYIERWRADQKKEISFVEGWSDSPSDMPFMELVDKRNWICSEKDEAIIRHLDKTAVFWSAGSLASISLHSGAID